MDKLNSKLKNKQEIFSHLFSVYKEPSEDPHDDRREVSEQIDKNEANNVTYVVEEEGEELVEEPMSQYIPAMDEVAPDEEDAFEEDIQE